jgi:hypothetical protein
LHCLAVQRAHFFAFFRRALSVEIPVPACIHLRVQLAISLLPMFFGYCALPSTSFRHKSMQLLRGVSRSREAANWIPIHP